MKMSEMENASGVRDEQNLLSRVALKDEKAFEDLYQQYSQRVFRYAHLRLGDKHVAEEVVQETLWAVWQGAHRYRERSKPSTWIFGIAHNKVVDHLKKRIRQNQIDEEFQIPIDAEAGPNLFKHELLHSALAKVSEPCRDAIILSFFYRFNYKEIGEILGCNEGTVKNRVFRGKEQLRNFLESESCLGR